jgi:hypothetical protein
MSKHYGLHGGLEGFREERVSLRVPMPQELDTHHAVL